MTPELISICVLIIRMGVQLGVDVYSLIKDAGFNDADVETLCGMVDKAREELRKPV
jgi:hypothetical protein